MFSNLKFLIWGPHQFLLAEGLPSDLFPPLDSPVLSHRGKAKKLLKT